MDELTLLRSTRDDTLEPSAKALAAGRAALLERASNEGAATSKISPRTKRSVLPRLTWTAAGLAAAVTVVLVAGSFNLTIQSAHASEVLRGAAAQTMQNDGPVPGPGEYLRSHTRAMWMGCMDNTIDGTGTLLCEPSEQIIDVYMPADADTDWVLVRDWGEQSGVFSEASVETTRQADGNFYGPGTWWTAADVADIPTDGAEAYAWIDEQYSGGSASRAEENFERISSILRTGLVPAPQRAALLDALSRVPGVTSTDGVANLDGVMGVAIGRDEPFRFGQRQEVIVDPGTGLVIGDRTISGISFMGLGPDDVLAHTAIETTVVSSAP